METPFELFGEDQSGMPEINSRRTRSGEGFLPKPPKTLALGRWNIASDAKVNRDSDLPQLSANC
jgi:hypothetical protein